MNCIPVGIGLASIQLGHLKSWPILANDVLRGIILYQIHEWLISCCSSNRFEMPSFHAMSFFLFLRLFLRFTNDVGLENMLILLWNRRIPQPKANPTQEKTRVKSGIRGATFSPQRIIFFVGWWFILHRKRYYNKNPTEPRIIDLQGSYLSDGRV